MIFKLHQMKNMPRAQREIRLYAPEILLVYSDGTTMI